MTTVLFTGFPGFLGSALLPRVLARDASAEAICLVQPRWAPLARERIDELTHLSPSLRGRVRLVEGDITLPDLGLRHAATIAARTSEVYHLAAIYDLSVGRELAMRVNVEGTRNVLAFARSCTALRRFQYLSTCYVSGRHPGVFDEDQLEVGQRFNNFYEETKYLAEIEVRRAMQAGLPATIYRPSVVVGDSSTGATQKYDGPYFVIQWLLRQPPVALFPVVGDTKRTVFNMVPRDFVIDAITWLSGREESSGRCYQLADPRPLTVDAILRELARSTRRRMIRVPLPVGVAKASIDHVPGVYRLLRIPSSAVDYFVHPTRYATAKAQSALAPSGIRCPAFPEYVDRLVDFARAHPEVGAAAMV